MKRLYKFFFLLFFILLLLSFLFSILVSRGIYTYIRVGDRPENILIGDIPLQVHFEIALGHMLIYSVVMFSSLVFLFRSAFLQQKKFTLSMIIGYITRFFILNLLVFVIIFIWFLVSKNQIGLYLLTGHIFSLPHPAWWPFPLVWIALFIFYAEKIKNNPEEYGRQD